MWAIKSFREKLAAGKVCVGTAITFNDPLISEALADSSDFLWIDLEHSPMSPETYMGHMMAARGKNCPALVRVPGSETAFIKPVLDGGAEGIIVPQVRSADEVRRIVDDCRYPPRGKRGIGPRVPGNYGRVGGEKYLNETNDQVFTCVQIENTDGLNALDEILKIEELDSIVLGPVDLSASLGHPWQVEHPEVVAAMESVISRTRTAGKFIGSGMGADVGFAQRMVKRGAQWLQVGADFAWMIEAMDRVKSQIVAGLK